MFDPEFINPIAEAGLKLLYQSELFSNQIEADRKRLFAGDPDEDEAHLAKAIKQSRQKVGILETLHLMGEELSKKENE